LVELFDGDSERGPATTTRWWIQILRRRSTSGGLAFFPAHVEREEEREKQFGREAEVLW